MIGGIVAVGTADLSDHWKGLIVLALVLSYLACDMIPHKHLWDRDQLKKTWKGAAAELVMGLIALPLFIWYFAQIDFWWLIICVVAANLLELGVAAEKFGQYIGINLNFISKINHAVHFWEEKTDNFDKWLLEGFQTAILLLLLLIALFTN